VRTGMAHQCCIHLVCVCVGFNNSPHETDSNQLQGTEEEPVDFETEGVTNNEEFRPGSVQIQSQPVAGSSAVPTAGQDQIKAQQYRCFLRIRSGSSKRFKYNEIHQVLGNPKAVRALLHRYISDFCHARDRLAIEYANRSAVKKVALQCLGGWTFYCEKLDSWTDDEILEWNYARASVTQIIQQALPFSLHPFDNLSVQFYDVNAKETFQMLNGLGEINLWETFQRTLQPNHWVSFYCTVPGFGYLDPKSNPYKMGVVCSAENKASSADRER